MHNTLKRAVIATNQKAQYDVKVKNLLGHKIILAHILTRTVDEKMSIMETEYDIELEENLRRDVSTMCNLSEGIEEKGIAIGEARAEATMIARMHKNGMQPEQIAAVTEKSIVEVRKIIADRENG